MHVETISAPAVEPLTLAQARAQLRVTATAEDSYIEDDLIPGTRAEVETFTRLRLITQTVRVTMDGFPPGGVIRLPVWPVQSIAKIEYKDEAGSWTEVAGADYELSLSTKPARVVPAYQKIWPVPRAWFDSVRVEAVVGFGDAGSDVPPDILRAMQLIMGAMFENREDTAIGVSVARIPHGAREKLLPHVLHFEGC